MCHARNVRKYLRYQVWLSALDLTLVSECSGLCRVFALSLALHGSIRINSAANLHAEM